MFFSKSMSSSQGLSNHSSRCTTSLETTTHNIIKIPSLFSLIAGNLEKRAVFTCISRRPTCEVGRRLVLLFYEDEARCLDAIEWSSGPFTPLTDGPRWASRQLWSSWRNEFKLNNWRHKFSFDVPVQDVPGAMHSSRATGSISLPGLQALPPSIALATMASTSVPSSNCTTCCAKKGWVPLAPVFGHGRVRKKKVYLHHKE